MCCFFGSGPILRCRIGGETGPGTHGLLLTLPFPNLFVQLRRTMIGTFTAKLYVYICKQYLSVCTRPLNSTPRFRLNPAWAAAPSGSTPRAGTTFTGPTAVPWTLPFRSSAGCFAASLTAGATPPTCCKLQFLSLGINFFRKSL